MANKSISQLRDQINAVEARLRNERKEMKSALRTTPGLVKASLSSRKGMAVAFLAATVAGVVWAMRFRRRSGKAPRRIWSP